MESPCNLRTLFPNDEPAFQCLRSEERKYTKEWWDHVERSKSQGGEPRDPLVMKLIEAYDRLENGDWVLDKTPFKGDEILRTVVGSGVHGLAIEGTDDHDEMGVFIERRSMVIGLDPPMDTYTWRTQPEGARSGPGDTDYVAYSLRHFLNLAIAGNPTVLLPFFAPEASLLIETKLGGQLRSMRNCFLSREAAWRFLRYSEQQYERMHGRGKQNRVPNRPS